MSNLFYSRNQLNILLSEKLIYQEDLKNNYLMIVDNLFISKDYKKTLASIANQELWSKFLINNTFKKEISRKSNSFVIFLKLMVFIFFYKIYVKNSLIKYNIQNVYISNPRAIDELIIFSESKKLKLNINVIEEGLSSYLNKTNKKHSISEKIIKKFVSSKEEEILFYKAYGHFPKLLKFKAEKKIELQYGFLAKTKSLIEIDSIYLSQPLSESNRITLDQELQLLNSIFNHYPRTYIKFHPRDSIEKKNLISNKFKISYLSSEYCDMAFENLLNSFKINTILGFYSSSMFYACKNHNTKVVSFIKWLKDIEGYSEIFDFTTKNFKQIEIFNGPWEVNNEI